MKLMPSSKKIDAVLQPLFRGIALQKGADRIAERLFIVDTCDL